MSSEAGQLTSGRDINSIVSSERRSTFSAINDKCQRYSRSKQARSQYKKEIVESENDTECHEIPLYIGKEADNTEIYELKKTLPERKKEIKQEIDNISQQKYSGCTTEDLEGKLKEVTEVEKREKELVNKIIESNKGLVCFWLKRYNAMGNPYLEQAGMMGLWKALNKYDGRTKFSTYASIWIRSKLSRAISCDKIIHTPKKHADIIKAIREYESANEKPPEVEDIKIKGKNKKCIEAVLRPIQCVSLDQAIHDEHDLYSLVADKKSTEPYLEDELGLKDSLKNALQVLNDREKRIIELRFGLNGTPTHTFEEVGKIFGVSRTCIQQIQERAFKKIRKNTPSLEHHLIETYAFQAVKQRKE